MRLLTFYRTFFKILVKSHISIMVTFTIFLEISIFCVDLLWFFTRKTYNLWILKFEKIAKKIKKSVRKLSGHFQFPKILSICYYFLSMAKMFLFFLSCFDLNFQKTEQTTKNLYFTKKSYFLVISTHFAIDYRISSKVELWHRDFFMSLQFQSQFTRFTNTMS